MASKKKVIFTLLGAIALLAFVIAAFFYFSSTKTTAPSEYETVILSIGEHEITAEVADTRQKQSLGLSNRESLGQNEGMLFVYNEKQYRTFWMHKMNFNLDFIWIANNQVVGIHENVPYPQGNESPETVRSPKEVDKILEVNAGWIEENFKDKEDIIGTSVSLTQ